MNKSLLLVSLVFIASCKTKVVKVQPLLSAISSSVYASGTVKSFQQYQAFASVSGIIKEVYVKEGDTVKTGTSILAIANEIQQLNKENAALAAQYSSVSVNADKLEDALQNANLQKSRMKNDLLLLNRQKALWQQNIGTKVELEQRNLTYDASKTAYGSTVSKYNELKRQLDFTASQSEKNLQVAKSQAGDFTLKSKVDGIVYKIYKEKGEAVSPQTPLALVGSGTSWIMELQVDEYDIFKIKPGLLVLVTMDSYKEKVYKGRISSISPMMNQGTKTFLVEAVFEDPPAKLYPFISLEANIVIETKEQALLVPRNAFLNDSTLVRSNGEQVFVKTGLKDYKMVEIRSGITAADELIIPEK